MSKVLVDRELLENCLDAAKDAYAATLLKDLQSILAQPAEAEGVEVVGVIDEADEGCFVELMDDRSFRLGEKLVRQSDHLAALSAVTAERDRLLSDNASLRGSCKALGEENKQLKRENKRQGRTIAHIAQTAERDDLRLQVEAARSACTESQGAILGLIAERDQLRAEVEMLRKDAERYRWLREMHQSPCGLTLTIARVGMMELTGWSGDDPDSVIDAAMQGASNGD